LLKCDIEDLLENKLLVRCDLLKEDMHDWLELQDSNNFASQCVFQTFSLEDKPIP